MNRRYPSLNTAARTDARMELKTVCELILLLVVANGTPLLLS
jgi:hypothetical protein